MEDDGSRRYDEQIELANLDEDIVQIAEKKKFNEQKMNSSTYQQMATIFRFTDVHHS